MPDLQLASQPQVITTQYPLASTKLYCLMTEARVLTTCPGVHSIARKAGFESLVPSVLWHCWLGDRKGIRPVKKLDIGLLVVMIWLELCTTCSSSSPVVTTTYIILCFNKHRLTQVHLENGHYNGDRECPNHSATEPHSERHSLNCKPSTMAQQSQNDDPIRAHAPLNLWKKFSSPPKDG